MEDVVGKVVVARAPGKVILSGEHAVVHGTAAVAAALNRYTVARIHLPHPDASKGFLSLRLPDVGVHLEWPMSVISKALDITSGSIPSAVDSAEALKATIEEFVAKEGIGNKLAFGGVVTFLFLYASILKLQPATVIISTELPLGSGLGSSASFCVALSAALLTLVGKLEVLHDGKALLPNALDLDKIDWLDVSENGRGLVNSWAFEGEKILHGRPSGVDNTVSCYGHIVRFKQGHLTRLKSPAHLRILVSNTKVGRNTKALVAGVGERAKRHPKSMTAVFSAVDAIAEEIREILESPPEDVKLEVEDTKDEKDDRIGSLVILGDLVIDTGHGGGGTKQPQSTPTSLRRSERTRLEELVSMNQGLLQCMGVSHPSIESVCQITSRFNLSSKLTGAGGGGCVFTVLPNDLGAENLEKMKGKLTLEGFDSFEAKIGVEGIQIGFRTSLLGDA